MNGFARLQGGQPVDDESTSVCRDLPDAACCEQQRNIALHVISLSLTRAGEGLAWFAASDAPDRNGRPIGTSIVSLRGGSGY